MIEEIKNNMIFTILDFMFSKDMLKILVLFMMAIYILSLIKKWKKIYEDEYKNDEK